MEVGQPGGFLEDVGLAVPPPLLHNLATLPLTWSGVETALVLSLCTVLGTGLQPVKILLFPELSVPRMSQGDKTVLVQQSRNGRKGSRHSDVGLNTVLTFSCPKC